MNQQIVSIRPFVGALDYQLSRAFYREWGFEEVVLSENMCLFQSNGFGFYLQRAYVKDWVDNTMVFLHVADVDAYFTMLVTLDLPIKFKGTKLVPIQYQPWGKECFLHDPSGILWHIGSFNSLD